MQERNRKNRVPEEDRPFLSDIEAVLLPIFTTSRKVPLWIEWLCGPFCLGSCPSASTDEDSTPHLITPSLGASLRSHLDVPSSPGLGVATLITASASEKVGT